MNHKRGKPKLAYIVYLNNVFSGDEDIFVTTKRRCEKAEDDNDYALQLSTSSLVENFNSLEDCINTVIDRGMRVGMIARGVIY